MIVGPGNRFIWKIEEPEWQDKADRYMAILEESGHPVMRAEYTYDIRIKNIKNNDPYHMLDTPHNEFHMISMMVTQARVPCPVCQYY